MTDHPPLELIDVYAATIPTVKFQSGGPRQLCRDGAADEGGAQAEGLSAELGGSGVAVPE